MKFAGQNNNADKEEKISHPHTLALFFFFLLLFCLSCTQTHFNHGETWQQITVSILNLINGNDSSVIHLSWVAFLFLSFREEWTPFGWRPSLLISHSPNAWRLENLLWVCDKACCDCFFFVFDIYVWYNVPKVVSYFISNFNKQHCPLLIDMSRERERGSQGSWKQSEKHTIAHIHFLPPSFSWMSV